MSEKLPTLCKYIRFDKWDEYTNVTGKPVPDCINIVVVDNQNDYDTLLDAITNQVFETVVPMLIDGPVCSTLKNPPKVFEDIAKIDKQERLRHATQLVRDFTGEDDYQAETTLVNFKLGVRKEE